MNGVEAGALLTKISVYKAMAEYVLDVTDGAIKWTPEDCGTKLVAYLAKFRETYRNYDSVTGGKYSLTLEDIKNNVTIEGKLFKDCHYFRLLEKLFGGRQNVNPTNSLQPKLPSIKTANSYENTKDTIDDNVSEFVYCETFDDLDDFREEIPIIKKRKYQNLNYNGYNDENFKQMESQSTTTIRNNSFVLNSNNVESMQGNHFVLLSLFSNNKTFINNSKS